MDATQAAPEAEPGSVPPLTELRPERPPARLHRPRRAIVVAIELIFAGVLVAAAVWAWQRSVIPYELPSSDNPAVPRFVDRQSGPWVGAAFGFAALAGVLVLDAVRQVVLVARVRGRHRAGAGAGVGG